jgi:hypothetical protein
VLVQTKNAPILYLLKQFGQDATIALGMIMQMFMLLVMLILQQIPQHVVLEV